jgi:hypothetical protein
MDDLAWFGLWMDGGSKDTVLILQGSPPVDPQDPLLNGTVALH